MTAEPANPGSLTVRASRIATAAKTIREARAREEKRCAEAVCSAAVRIRGALQIECQRLRSELGAVVKQTLGQGVVPSLLQVTGLSHLERPYNALLAWWAQVDGEHGLGRDFLMAIGEATGFKRFVDDLAGGDMPDVRAEQALDAAMSSRQPDLMVRTQNAAILIENKVEAKESGDGQYADYLELLEWWAEGRDTRAVLLARDQREIPNGYHCMLTHAELAEVFEVLAQSEDRGSRWGRISAAIMAATLHDETTRREARWHRMARRVFALPPAGLGQDYLALIELTSASPVKSRELMNFERRDASESMD